MSHNGCVPFRVVGAGVGQVVTLVEDKSIFGGKDD